MCKTDHKKTTRLDKLLISLLTRICINLINMFALQTKRTDFIVYFVATIVTVLIVAFATVAFLRH